MQSHDSYLLTWPAARQLALPVRLHFCLSECTLFTARVVLLHQPRVLWMRVTDCACALSRLSVMSSMFALCAAMLWEENHVAVVGGQFSEHFAD